MLHCVLSHDMRLLYCVVIRFFSFLFPWLAWLVGYIVLWFLCSMMLHCVLSHDTIIIVMVIVIVVIVLCRVSLSLASVRTQDERRRRDRSGSGAAKAERASPPPPASPAAREASQFQVDSPADAYARCASD